MLFTLKIRYITLDSTTKHQNYLSFFRLFDENAFITCLFHSKIEPQKLVWFGHCLLVTLVKKENERLFQNGRKPWESA